MDYSNPEIPEGINTSKTHPLHEFVWLTGGVLALLLGALLVLTVLTDMLASHIPFSVERHFASRFEQPDAAQQPLQDYLQGLAQRVARAQNLPKDMPVTVHYVDGDTVNAFATLGGHVVLFRGLLERLPNENALALLIAHEVAHIKHRDPIKGAGRGVVLGLSLGLVSDSIGNAVLDSFLGNAGYLTVLKFSRQQESQADAEALDTVTRLYGSLQGAEALMQVLVEEETRHGHPVAFLSTHPLSEQRLQELQDLQADMAASPRSTTPLPAHFSAWLGLEEPPLAQ